jgi:DNA/RNA-binding domain of Phe-tRNA-synthetase-like protein
MTPNLQLDIDESLATKFPGLRANLCEITGLSVQNRSPALEELRDVVVNEIKSTYTLETLKDVPTFRAYRDFFWRVGIDPTKIRPAAEALIRRILADKPLPNINTLVDAYNLASVRTGVALAAFDQEKVHGKFLMRQAKASEEFFGIGMDKPMRLSGVEVIVADKEKLVAVYPYRDADSSKVTESTQDIVLMVCGCPGIRDETLSSAEKVAVEMILHICNGKKV